jgi:hypothetical protein
LRKWNNRINRTKQFLEFEDKGEGRNSLIKTVLNVIADRHLVFLEYLGKILTEYLREK